MPTFIALLRAVNVAGHQPVAMADLRRFLSDLGYDNPRSFLQSGNLVFDAPGGQSSRLEARLEQEAARRLGLRTAFFVRTAAEWRAIVARNPFVEEVGSGPARVALMLAKRRPEPSRLAALQAAIRGREVVAGGARHLYAVYPDGFGRSRLTLAVIEKAIGSPSTARNWNTVLRLAAACKP
jgi:uncharacterized protein (DUF1697 family)